MRAGLICCWSEAADGVCWEEAQDAVAFLRHETTEPPMSEPLQPDHCARVLQALADPQRLRIIHCLRGGARNVTELAGLLGAEVVNVSHHLGVLRHAGLVQDEKQGRFVLYRLHPDVFHPTSADAGDAEHLDLGCCRLEIPKN
jgi:ArsR family transcriptional regulator